MNVGNITSLGSKGQIVIPSQIRKAMGVGPSDPVRVTLVGKGAFVQPVDVFPKVEQDDSAFLAFLAKYRGIWGSETVEERKLRIARKKKELKRAREMSQKW